MAFKGNLLYAQSGGPTSVINSSAYGVFKAAFESDHIGQVFAGLNGIQGIEEDHLVPISQSMLRSYSLLLQTPGAAFGSCRKMLKPFEEDESEYRLILEEFKKRNIKYFLYNGGNDSMDTVKKLSQYFAKIGFDCYVIGIPKTIDNDLAQTDHTPGYGSAAKYIATVFSEIAYDASAYEKGRVNVIEIMGRDTGWLTASAALARLNGYGPDLIYVPEVPFSRERFISEVKNVYHLKNRCMVAVSEGIKDSEGKFISDETSLDAFGHKQLGGISSYLASLASQAGLPTRGIELSLAQRSAAHLASLTDIQEAQAAGEEAVKDVTSGLTGFMVNFLRQSIKPYKISLGLAPIDKVASIVKLVPLEFLEPAESDVSEEFISYALPLIQGERKYKTVNGLIKFYEE